MFTQKRLTIMLAASLLFQTTVSADTFFYEALPSDSLPRKMMLDYRAAIEGKVSKDIETIERDINARYDCSRFPDLISKTHIDDTQANLHVNIGCVYTILAQEPLVGEILRYAESSLENVQKISFGYEDNDSLGYYRPMTKVIQVDSLSYFDVLTHEITHGVMDSLFANRSRPYLFSPFEISVQASDMKEAVEQVFTNVKDCPGRFCYEIRGYKEYYSPSQYASEAIVWYPQFLMTEHRDDEELRALKPIADYWHKHLLNKNNRFVEQTFSEQITKNFYSIDNIFSLLFSTMFGNIIYDLTKMINVLVNGRHIFSRTDLEFSITLGLYAGFNLSHISMGLVIDGIDKVKACFAALWK